MPPHLGRNLAVLAGLALLAACNGNSSPPDADAARDVDADEDTEDHADLPLDDGTADDSADGSDVGTCPAGEALNPYLTPPACVPCARACALEGETGEVWPVTALTGQCVCTTQDGYYFSLSGAAVSHRCDRDGDGWVTQSARANVESSDPAIAENARCDVRVVDRVVLLAEHEDPDLDGCEVDLAETELGVDSLALYEADNRDDQELLDDDPHAPLYGARRLRAEELNGMTKACVSLIADYNSSGEADVNEWDLGSEPIHAFSYFIELHRGWYAAGAYYIQEKSRLAVAPAGWGIPLVYNDDGYWRECVRLTDGAFDPLGPNALGMDFARYDADPWTAGLAHHSQYKCVHLVEENPDPAAYPQRLPRSELDAVPRRYVLNGCEGTADSAEPVAGTVNPRDPGLTCAINTLPVIDDVGFAAVKYIHYETPGAYQRGCVNGCLESPPTCPPAASCAPDINDYGRPECVCPNHWTGEDCDVCPPHWDPAADCDACVNAYDPASDCTACLAHYDAATDCTDCEPRWDLATGCTTCINHYDVTTGCSTCLYHYDPATGCTECELHFDPFTSCATCLWNWDLTADCTDCLLDFSPSTDCRRTTNLLVNPGAEAGNTSGWSTVSGMTALTLASGCGTHTTTPHSGSYRFLCCADPLEECRATQDVNVSAYAAGIDAGRYTAEWDAWMFGYVGDAGVWLEFFDELSASLGSSAQIEVPATTWTRAGAGGIVLPVGTRTIRMMLDADAGFWSGTDCGWDDLALYLVE
ncbi:MAG: hypothetical protein JXB32_21920 [Deltaproteobacteria bacterium]|nr:hypothetical protein [Deltaproteobacteria bacterium]